MDPEGKKQEEVKKRQNIIFGTLLFIGLAAFSLGIFQIMGNIGAPFKVKEDKNKPESPLLTNSTQEEELTQLRNKDTDKDGLNDFDELYVYGTSPYVRDSDSDGHPDNEEVETDNDPNCPTGQTCGILEETASNSNTNATLPSQGELSSQDLRATLKKLGAPANLIDSMDDATLLEVYQQTVAETGITPEGLEEEPLPNLEELIPEETSGQEITLEALKSLTTSQLRDLLKQSGIDEATLSQVDDATLEAIYQEALGQQLTSPTP